MSLAARPAVRETLVVLLFLALAAFATRPLAADLSGQIPAGADPALYVWTVDWLSGHVLDPGQLFEGNLYHPVRHAVLLSDLAFGTALLATPLRPLVRDPVPLYNLALLATLAFGGWGFYTLVRVRTGSVAAGLVAGILAAFGSHQVLHLPQLALVNIGWLALFLLALMRMVEAGRGWTPLCGAAFALNALSSGYFAVAGAVLAILFAVVEWRQVLKAWPRCALATAIAALLLLPYARAFLYLQQTEGIKRSVEVNLDQAFVPARDLTSDVYLYRHLLGPSRGERLFPGAACLLLAGLALRRRVAGGAFYAAGAALLLLLSLGPELAVGGRTLPMPYGLLFEVPPFDAMMHPYTFAAVARLLLCVLAGLGFATLGTRASVPAALFVALAETVAPGIRLRPVAPGVPPVYSALESLPPGAVLDVPPEEPDTLIWAARHCRPVLNGAGAMAPLDHDRLNQWIKRDWVAASHERRPIDLDRTRALHKLLRMPVPYVIVPAGRDRGLDLLQDAFERSAFFERVAGEPGGDTLYRRRP